MRFPIVRFPRILTKSLSEKSSSAEGNPGTSEVEGQWMQLQDFIRTLLEEAYRPYKIGEQLYWAFTKVMPMKCLDRRRVRIVAS